MLFRLIVEWSVRDLETMEFISRFGAFFFLWDGTIGFEEAQRPRFGACGYIIAIVYHTVSGD